MKSIKKILAFAIVLSMISTLLMVSSVSAATTFECDIVMTGPEGEVKAGDTIEVPIHITNRNGLKGLGFKIAWDPTLLDIDNTYNADDDIYVGYDFGNKATVFNQMCDINFQKDSIMVAGLRKSAYGSAGQVQLGTLTFTVLEAAAGKDVTISFVIEDYVGGELTDVTCGNLATGDARFANSDPVTFKVAGGAPVDPYDLKTDYVAAAKNIPVTSQYGTYNVNTALIFGSSINAGSADVFGTEITLKGYVGNPIDLVASEDAKYDAGAGKTGFTAAVTSIRTANLGETFVAKAYAIDANDEKVYGAEKEAVFNDVFADN